jgi:molecular chaperone HscB
MDHFARLGLPRRFPLDAREIECQYLARSRELHPDFHQTGSAAEQAASLDLSARLNEANAVLRDPFKRAEYLLALEGGPTAAEQKEMPAEFLEEILELRIEIEELRETEPLDSPARQSMERRLTERRETILAEIGDAFEKLTGASDRVGVLRKIRQRLNALKYVQNLLRDLQSE